MIWHCTTPIVDTSFMPYFEEVHFKKANGQLVDAKHKLAMPKLQQATEWIRFSKPLESFYLLSNAAICKCRCDFESFEHTIGRTVLLLDQMFRYKPFPRISTRILFSLRST